MLYFDNAATTPCRPEVAEALRDSLIQAWGNPSSVHGVGQEARKALDGARDRVAELLGSKPEELYFTGSGTEADNMALVGAFLQQRSQRRHLITAATEHHAVLHTARWLQELGAELTVLPVDREGRVDPEELRRALRPDTFLVSLMAANNEIGTLAPVADLARICHEAGALFHTDAVQWAGALPLDLRQWDADFVTLTAHKFYGPKGTGMLYARRSARFKALVHGGSQERGRRAGTENVAGAVAFARALELAVEELPEVTPRLIALRDRLIDSVLERIPGAKLNGPRQERLPNNAHFSFPGAESDLLVLSLDLEGVACSSGSACMAGAVEPSHVVQALGVPHAEQISAIRFSLGRTTTEADVDELVDILEKTVARIRS